MVSRHWIGLAKPDCADAYVEHLESETFPAMRRLAGFVSASILRRAVDEGVEFLIVTNWQSREAIRAFAGANIDEAVVPEKVERMMVRCDRAVRHYEIVD